MKSYPQALKDAVVGMSKTWLQVPERIEDCWEPLCELSKSIGALLLILVGPFLLPFSPFVALMIQADERKVARENEEFKRKVQEHYGSRRQNSKEHA